MAPLALLLLTAVRLAVAATVPLAPDEAYYWVWSRALQPGYLDHSPMVALWIRLGTALAGETALGVRLLGPLAAAAGSWFVADAANRLFPRERPGVAAAVLLNATLTVGAGAVTMTPDTPLLFFATAVLWALSRVGADGRWWVVAGGAIGAALDSKYTGALLAVAPAIAVAGTRRFAVLRSPWPWLGAALALLLFAPVIGWNAAHGWASFAKQGGRTGDWHPALAGRYLLELLGGQVGLATPLLFGLFAAGLWRSARAARRGEAADILLLSLSVPGLLVFAQHAIGARVQANWVAVVYPPLAIGGALVARRWQRPAAALGFAVTAVVYLQAAVAPFPLPRRLDPTLQRLAGWAALTQSAEAMQRANGLAFIATEEYGQAAELAWWSTGSPVIGVEPRWRLFDRPRAPGGTGLLLISERRPEPPDPAAWRDVVPLGRLVRERGGMEAEAFRVYRATLMTNAASAEMPRRGEE